mmetsp:Transcript_33177/g.59377  ORF Transcript_33177/g.59377 Transcript_33177/m.59377 type:complete len:323 (-) Transcript_33177:730-1698(-)
MLLPEPGTQLDHWVGLQIRAAEGVGDVADVVEEEGQPVGHVADGGHGRLGGVPHGVALVAVGQSGLGQAGLQQVVQSGEERLREAVPGSDGRVLPGAGQGQLLHVLTILRLGVQVEDEQPRVVCVVLGQPNAFIWFGHHPISKQDDLPAVAPLHRQGICSLQGRQEIGAPHIGAELVDKAATPQEVVCREIQTPSLVQHLECVAEEDDIEAHRLRQALQAQLCAALHLSDPVVHAPTAVDEEHDLRVRGQMLLLAEGGHDGHGQGVCLGLRNVALLLDNRHIHVVPCISQLQMQMEVIVQDDRVTRLENLLIPPCQLGALGI